MNKTEFIDALAKETGLTKKQSKEALEACLKTITTTLKKGEEVKFTGFGTFKTTKRAARNGRDPRTGKTIKIKASTVPAFKAGQTLKDAVNKKK